jgi:hypothetical protein
VRGIGASRPDRAPEDTGPRIPGPRTRSVSRDTARKWATRTSDTVRDARSDQVWVQDPLLLTDEERQALDHDMNTRQSRSVFTQ